MLGLAIAIPGVTGLLAFFNLIAFNRNSELSLLDISKIKYASALSAKINGRGGDFHE